MSDNWRRTREIEQNLGALAGRQHGMVTRRQLMDLGLDDDAIGRRVRTARLYRIHHGVYAVGRRPATWLERAAAVVLACGDHAVLSHGSALALWDLAAPTPGFHVTVTRGCRRPREIVVHRCALTRADITTQRGIRTTAPARTLLDCAPGLSERALARAVNEARHAHVLAVEQLRDALARFPIHPGARRLRPHAETTDGATRSEWEDDFPAFCARHGLPRPRLNATVCGLVVDALFEVERVIVELDSWQFHGDRAAFERDRERDAVTAAAGYVTVRLTWRRTHGDQATVGARLRETLARRR